MMEKLKCGLIVSCQALEDEPLYGDGIMAKMSLAALQGGAVGIRSISVRDITQIKETVDLPVIGIIKKVYPDCDVYITPTMDEVDQVVAAGAEIVAIDCTNRARPDGKSMEEFIKEVKAKHDVKIMADISTFEEGVASACAGVDMVGTTLSGYTDYTVKQEGPDFELIERLAKELSIPVIAEGRISTPQDAKHSLELGAHAVVVGGAITRPKQITEKFVAGIVG